MKNEATMKGGAEMSNVGKRTICLTIVAVIMSMVVSLFYLPSTALASSVGGSTGVYLQGDVPPEEINHTVTFVDWDGTVIDTQIVEHGASAVAPTAVKHEGYTFIGWDKDFTNVTSDLVVIAQYKEIQEEEPIPPTPPTPDGGEGGKGIIPQTGDLQGLIPYILGGSVLLIIISTCSWVLLNRKKGEGDEE